MNKVADPLMEDLAKCGAVSLYEYVSALLRRASEARLREAELALLSLRAQIVERARAFDAAWHTWSSYWSEAFAWRRKMALSLDQPGQ